LTHDRANNRKRDKDHPDENEDHSGRRADGGDAGRVLVVDRFDCRPRPATRSFQPQQIILAHANLPPITHCYGQLLDLIRSRNPRP
jgi:hypothetical protein